MLTQVIFEHSYFVFKHTVVFIVVGSNVFPLSSCNDIYLYCIFIFIFSQDIKCYWCKQVLINTIKLPCFLLEV